MLTESSDIDLAEDLNNLDLASDYEPHDQDIEKVTEDENKEEEVPVKKTMKRQLNEGSPANDRRCSHITNAFEFICFIAKSSKKNNLLVCFRL